MTVADSERVDWYVDSRGDIEYKSLDVGVPERHRVGSDIYEVTATVDGEARSVSLVRPRIQGSIASEASAYIDGAETWAAVDDHEGVCSVLDWGVTEDGPWVATERAGRETLRDRLDEEQFDTDEAVAFASQCAEALEHLHSRRVNHHALTPERILVVDGEPVLLDTGTGVALDEHVGGIDALTTAYAAPEQFDPARFGEPDQRADVYRLGVICYELLTGSRPYEGATGAVLDSVTDPAATPSEHADLPTGVDKVVTTALATDPAERYRTVEAFRVALQERTGSSADAAWRQFGGGPAHSNHEPALGPTAPVEQFWSVNTGYHEVQSTPVVADGTVYVGGNDEAIHAIDVETSTYEWSVELPGTIFTTPAVVNDTVFVTSGEMVYALDAETGDELWTFSAGRFRTSPVVDDGTVYVASNDAFVYGLDAETGDQQWRFETGSSLAATPAVADGTVYVGGTDETVYALDAETGDEVWTFDDVSSVKNAPVVRYGRVYVAARGGTVHALDATDGTRIWQTDTDSRNIATPAVDGGTVFVGGDLVGLTALDADTGDEVWTFEERATATSPVVSDGVVFLGTDSGLYGVDAHTGTETWSLDLGEAVTTTPGLGKTDLFVGGADGSVLSVRGADNDTPTPEFGTCSGDVTMPSMERLQSPPGSWGVTSATPRRSRHAGGGGPNEDAVARWSFDPNAALSPPSMDNSGVVYVGDDRATLHAVDSDEGDVLWTTDGVADDDHEAVTDGNQVYTVCRPMAGDADSRVDGDQLSAVSADTGEPVWSVRGTGEFQTPAVTGDVLYALDNREVHALSTADGEHLWRQEIDASHTPVVGHGMVYLAAGSTLTALDAGLGIEQWTTDIPRGTAGVPALAHEQLYFATAEGSVLAVDAETGAQQWSVTVANEFRTGVAVEGETVYCAGNDGTVAALDAESGDRRWVHDAGSAVRSPLAVADAVYVAAHDAILALDGANGEVCWQRNTASRASPTGPTVGNNRVAFVDGDRRLRTMIPKSQGRSAGEPETIESDLGREDEGVERGDEYLSLAIENIDDPEEPTDEELRAVILGGVIDAWQTTHQQVTVRTDSIVPEAIDQISGATAQLFRHNVERLAEKGYVGWDNMNDYQLVTSRPSGVQFFEEVTGEVVIDDVDLLEVLEPLYEQTRESRDPRFSRADLQEQTYLEDDELDRIVWYLANAGKWVEDLLFIKGSVGYLDIHSTGQTPWATAKLNGAGKDLYEDIV
ncbi:PQQ-binding-like beta-propeller repeat protein [Halovenus rubra]|uniref:PQQ-binding-like beta-propeller repeat protein n=2 Tax=Halovenus rubra TaxID=869890 RepID=A0ACC7DZY7_9EURY|nr:PQQ-binding-like beta-propeller repeat protein [Halovenus rubra]